MRSGGAKSFPILLCGVGLVACAQILGFEDGVPDVTSSGGSASTTGNGGGSGAGTAGVGGVGAGGSGGAGASGTGGIGTGGSSAAGAGGLAGAGGTGGGGQDACGNSCDPGWVCATSLSASMTAQPAGWTFNGDAFFDAGSQSAVLTPDAGGKAGSVIYGHQIVTDSFTVSFEASLGSNAAGGDGMAFLLTTTGPTALGGNLGVTGLAGFGFELDTFNNSIPSCGEGQVFEHVAVDTLQDCGGNGVPNSLVVGSPPVQSLEDGAYHGCSIEVVNGSVSFVVDGNALITNFGIPGWVPGVAYWYGFAASTGSAWNLQHIRNVQITFATPRCL